VSKKFITPSPTYTRKLLERLSSALLLLGPSRLQARQLGRTSFHLFNLNLELSPAQSFVNQPFFISLHFLATTARLYSGRPRFRPLTDPTRVAALAWNLDISPEETLFHFKSRADVDRWTLYNDRELGGKANTLALSGYKIQSLSNRRLRCQTHVSEPVLNPSRCKALQCYETSGMWPSPGHRFKPS
jgi:hypothetical protein